MPCIILPYKVGSESAGALASALGVRRVNLNNTRLNRMNPRTVINWGNSGRDLTVDVERHTIINQQPAVRNASCKRRTLEILSERGVRTPLFSTSRQDAVQWLSGGRNRVVERHILTGNSGNGIRIVEQESELQDAPLYTQYVPKNDEYRVHVFRGQVFDVQRKARTRDVPDDQVNWQVRNLEGGFIFMREGVTLSSVPQDVITQAVRSVAVMGLDFGAVDVIWNNHRSEATVLEINTAPGLTGTTLERYTAVFSHVLNGAEFPVWGEGQQVSPSEVPDPGADLPVDRYIEVSEDTFRRLPNGVRVHIQPGSVFSVQAMGSTGSLSDPSTLDSQVWRAVNWHNGGINNYRSEDLLVREGDIPRELLQGDVVQSLPEDVQETVQEDTQRVEQGFVQSPPAPSAPVPPPAPTPVNITRVFGVFYNQVLLAEYGMFSTQEAAENVLHRNNLGAVNATVQPVQVNHA